MTITDTIYFMQFNQNDYNHWEFYYSIDEIMSIITSNLKNTRNIYDLQDIPKDQYLSLPEIIDLVDFKLSIQKFKSNECDKIYFSHVYTRIELSNGDIKSDTYIKPFYNLNDAINDSTKHFMSIVNLYNNNISDIDKIIEKYFCEYIISVFVISTSRIKFDSSIEMRKYYINNIFNISKEEMYDFLLKLIRYDERHYNYKGEYLTTRNHHQFIKNEYGYIELPLFSMETAENLRLDANKKI